MNRYLRGATLGMVLAGGLLFSAVAQHGFAHADGGQGIVIDSSAIPSTATSTADPSNSTTNVVPANFMPVNLGN